MINKKLENPVNLVILSLNAFRAVEFGEEKMDLPVLARHEHDLVFVLRAESELPLGALRHRILFVIKLHVQFARFDRYVPGLRRV